MPKEKDSESNSCDEGSSDEGDEPDLARVLLTKISPPLYINSRKLTKESSTKKYHTVIEPFDL